MDRKPWRQRLGLAMRLALLAGLVGLTGCGKKSSGGEESAPEPNGTAPAMPGEGPPAMPGEGPPAMPGDSALGGDPGMMDPGMGGAPGTGTEPGMPGATGEAAPAPVDVKPLHPVRSDPFRALDNPVVPPPPNAGLLMPPPPSQQLQPIRATVSVSLPPDTTAQGEDTRLPGVRTSGILWGPTVKAVVQYRDAAGAEQSSVVKPGDELPITTPGGNQLTVQSIGPDGVRFQNARTGQVYFAPLEGR